MQLRGALVVLAATLVAACDFREELGPIQSRALDSDGGAEVLPKDETPPVDGSGTSPDASTDASTDVLEDASADASSDADTGTTLGFEQGISDDSLIGYRGSTWHRLNIVLSAISQSCRRVEQGCVGAWAPLESAELRMTFLSPSSPEGSFELRPPPDPCGSEPARTSFEAVLIEPSSTASETRTWARTGNVQLRTWIATGHQGTFDLVLTDGRRLQGQFKAANCFELSQRAFACDEGCSDYVCSDPFQANRVFDPVSGECFPK